MRSLWKQCLALALGSLAASASAQDVGWRANSASSASAPPAVTATIGKPIASSTPAPAAQPATQPAASIAAIGKPVAIASSRVEEAPGAQQTGAVVRGSAPEVMPAAAPVNGAQSGLHTWQRPGEVTPVTFKTMPVGHAANTLPAPTPTATPGHGTVPAANAQTIPYPAPIGSHAPIASPAPLGNHAPAYNAIPGVPAGVPSGVNVAPGAPLAGPPSMFGCDSAPVAGCVPAPACPPVQNCAPAAQCCTGPAHCGQGKFGHGKHAMGGLFGGWFGGHAHGHGSPLTDGGCLPDVCPPGNTWFVGAEYLLWSVRGDTTPPLVTGGPVNANPNVGVLGVPGTQTLFGGNEIGDLTQSGSRLTVGLWFSQAHYWGIEASAFMLGRQSDTFFAASLGDTILARPIIDLRPFVVNAAGVTVVNPAFGQESRERVADPGLAGSVAVDRSSTLWGSEFNFRRGILCCENGFVDLLFGFRMMGLDENLQITERLTTRDMATPLSFTVMDRFETTNRFYGGQVGFDSEYRYCRWSLGVKAKVGVGNTQQTANLSGMTTVQAGNSAPVSGPGGLLVLQGTNLGRYSRNEFSVIPELGLTVGYQLTSCLRATVGYNFLYWSNVLRPGGTIDRGVNATYQPFSPISPNFTQNGVVAGNPARPAPVFNTSDFWAQGLTLGLELRW